MFSKQPKTLPNIQATFVRKFVTETFQKWPNLVTLDLAKSLLESSSSTTSHQLPIRCSLSLSLSLSLPPTSFDCQSKRFFVSAFVADDSSSSLKSENVYHQTLNKSWSPKTPLLFVSKQVSALIPKCDVGKQTMKVQQVS